MTRDEFEDAISRYGAANMKAGIAAVAGTQDEHAESMAIAASAWAKIINERDHLYDMLMGRPSSDQEIGSNGRTCADCTYALDDPDCGTGIILQCQLGMSNDGYMPLTRYDSTCCAFEPRMDDI